MMQLAHCDRHSCVFRPAVRSGGKPWRWLRLATGLVAALATGLVAVVATGLAATDRALGAVPAPSKAVVAVEPGEADRGTLSGNTAEAWARVLFFRDHNTRVVVGGATLLGVASGLVGCFALLRRRALLGDAVSHATLPGIGLAWLLGYWLGFDQKSLPLLLGGAAVTGVCGTLVILAIRRTTRLREDAALGIVLGVFFGAGVALLGQIQKIPSGSAAGLRSFIDGKAASLSTADVWWIAAALVLCSAAIWLFQKELRLLCFDEGFAASTGFPVLVLEILLMVLIVTVTIVGLQAVGLVLMVALLVIPPAAARFWSHRLNPTLGLAAATGGGSAALGAMASAVWPDLPSGPLIVLVAASAFAFSLFFGSERGMVPRLWQSWKLDRKTGLEHLLRALYELAETAARSRLGGQAWRPESGAAAFWVSEQDLLPRRSWSTRELNRLVNLAERRGEVLRNPTGGLRLTEAGLIEAARVVREHRLWELYLIAFAEVAPARVDRGADAIEHVLDPTVISRLEQMLDGKLASTAHLRSPHPLEGPGLPALPDPPSRQGEGPIR